MGIPDLHFKLNWVNLADIQFTHTQNKQQQQQKKKTPSKQLPCKQRGCKVERNMEKYLEISTLFLRSVFPEGREWTKKMEQTKNLLPFPTLSF